MAEDRRIIEESIWRPVRGEGLGDVFSDRYIAQWPLLKGIEITGDDEK